MNTLRFRLLSICALWLTSHCAMGATQSTDFDFAVIGQIVNSPNSAPNGTPNNYPNDVVTLEQSIAQSDNDNLAFVVANGFKRASEPCTDQFYEQRRDLLTGAKNGLIISLAGNDWSECKNGGGHPAAIERLTRLRELFFVDEFSLGASKLPLIRQSHAVKFRSYVENARWEVGNILFVSMNLPAQNNRYRMEAGRNSEFEDRLIANRDWLHRSFAIATHKKMTAVVLICDGDPLQKPIPRRLFESNTRRDGFTEIRQQLSSLAAKYPGKLLIIHNRLDDHVLQSNSISWHGNIGELEVGTQWMKINVQTSAPIRFSATLGGGS
jgi:hypothetical protein